MKVKKLVTMGAAIAIFMSMSVTAFAASANRTPADAVAGLTDKPVSEVIQHKKETGKTYGQIANEAGVLNQFKEEKLKLSKENLEDQVQNGKMTQEKADKIIAAIKENQANCDGSGNAAIGKANGARFGSNGEGLGTNGADKGSGIGKNSGNKNALCDGTGNANGARFGSNGEGIGSNKADKGSGIGKNAGNANGDCDGNGTRIQNGSCGNTPAQDKSGNGQGNGRNCNR